MLNVVRSDIILLSAERHRQSSTDVRRHSGIRRLLPQSTGRTRSTRRLQVVRQRPIVRQESAHRLVGTVRILFAAKIEILVQGVLGFLFFGYLSDMSEVVFSSSPWMAACRSSIRFSANFRSVRVVEVSVSRASYRFSSSFFFWITSDSFVRLLFSSSFISRRFRCSFLIWSWLCCSRTRAVASSVWSLSTASFRRVICTSRRLLVVCSSSSFDSSSLTFNSVLKQYNKFNSQSKPVLPTRFLLPFDQQVRRRVAHALHRLQLGGQLRQLLLQLVSLHLQLRH